VSLLDRIFSSSQPAEWPEGTRLVVGLGNPGPEYEGTRHNIGFELVDLMVSQREGKWQRESKLKAKIAIDGAGVCWAKPLTYMNLSGTAVARIARSRGLKPDQILVVYDDIALPLGRLRFRAEGSAGGHNGIKSMIASLATETFSRLRIGIGESRESGPEGGLVEHVLGRFSPEERPEVEKVLAIAADGVNCVLSEGLAAAMNRFNRRSD
jgi:peptidyl-tRNA hydrolase, PTH1 family